MPDEIVVLLLFIEILDEFMSFCADAHIMKSGLFFLSLSPTHDKTGA